MHGAAHANAPGRRLDPSGRADLVAMSDGQTTASAHAAGFAGAVSAESLS
jgi:hypothetical protein